jgi:prepilin-type N-terminal cleavage/methylation domain-containing protein
MAPRRQEGFTILELMIAVAVYAVALLLITTGVIAIGGAYQQGVTKAQLLTAAREIHSQITQDIQYGGEPPYVYPDSVSINEQPYTATCIGDTRYLVATDTDATQSNYGSFIVDNISSTACGSSSLTDAQYPLPANAKAVSSTDIDAFSLTDDHNGTYILQTRFVAGYVDMFNGNSYGGTCRSNLVSSEFCSVVTLTSNIGRKVND